MTKKIVKFAWIQVVSIKELRIGDSILISNMKATVINVDYQNRIVTVQEPIGELKPFRVYYKILSCKEIRPDTNCPGCGQIIPSLTEYNTEFCTPRCKDKYEEDIESELNE